MLFRSDELKAGSRIEVSKLKKNPIDFVLWKPSDINDPGWDSPWGRGRPGWHLECSVMSEKYLGKHFDIHGGGLDLIFPHHENEIAQSCSNNSSERFSNYWVHNGFVTINKEKMSKSLGNIISISEAVHKYSGQVVRLALLKVIILTPCDFTYNNISVNSLVEPLLENTISTSPFSTTPRSPCNAFTGLTKTVTWPTLHKEAARRSATKPDLPTPVVNNLPTRLAING